MTYKKPLPQVNSDTKPFWNGCRKHELRFQKCLDCGHVRWPPSIICTQCHSSNTEWIISSGKGKIYTYVIFHQVFHKGFVEDVPYVTASVELEEGPRLLSNVVEYDVNDIYCEMPVEVVWEEISEEFTLPKFRPLKDS